MAPAGADVSPMITAARKLQSRRPVRATLGLAAVVAMLTLVFAACSPEVIKTNDLVNASRAQNGMGAYGWNNDLYFKAQGWADQLARDGYLHHSNLADGAPAGWMSLGENVGVGYDLGQIQNAFMNSPGHRANILSGVFDADGIGVSRDAQGRYWVVHEFAQL